MRRLLSLLGVLALIAAFGAAACGGEEEEKTATAGAASLEQDDFYFQPTKLTGAVGKPLQVALKNEGKTTHTFTIDSLNIDEALKPDETRTVTVTPKSGGDLTFYCRFHVQSNGMKRTLTVSGGAGGASPSSPTKTSSSGGGYGY